MDDTNEQLGDEIRTAVERQLQQADLQEVNNTVDRLTDQGHSRENAIEMVGTVLLEEMQEMMTEAEPFDRDRYVERLREL